MLRRRRLAVSVVAAAAALAVVCGGAPPASGDDSTVLRSIVQRGSVWEIHTADTPPDAGWRTRTGSWRTGRAPIGRGEGAAPVVSTLLPDDGPARSLFLRRSFDLSADLPEWAWLNTWADDGIAVWVNGQEIGRHNAPDGPIAPGTYATAAPSTVRARQAPVTFVVPVELLRSGANIIAVQVLANWRATPDVSFDAHLVGEDRVAVVQPEPSAPPEPAPPAEPPPEDGEVAGWGAPDWRDEFTYRDPRTGEPRVDPARWNIRGRQDLGLLFDAAVVDPAQASVDDAGVLHIRADWLDAPVIRPDGQAGPRELWHRTGYLDQRALDDGDVAMAQRFGRWEIRAKTPTGPHTLGALAAFWLRNEQSGEIDIMEAWGYDETAVRDQRIDTATTTVHTHTADPSQNRRYIWHHADAGGPDDVWRDFHVYAFEYTPEYAAIVVDGVELIRATPSSHPNLWDTRFFGTPLHMRLNLHVGPSATYWGLPDPNDRSATQSLDFQVDYVRVWHHTAE